MAAGSGSSITIRPSHSRPRSRRLPGGRCTSLAATTLYWDYAFGSASLTFDLELPGDVVEATDWLFASHDLWTRELAALTDADLDRTGANERGELWPLHRVFAKLINEQVHHGAEISLLRDLFRCRDSLGLRSGR